MEPTVTSYFISVLWQGGQKFYDSLSFNNELESLYLTIHKHITSIPLSFLHSAQQAIIAAGHSKNNYNGEILDAIVHLRDAYNFAKLHAFDTKPVHPILRFFNKLEYGDPEMDAQFIIPERSMDEYWIAIAKMAGLIAILYNTLGEEENILDWKFNAAEALKVVVAWNDHLPVASQEEDVENVLPEYLVMREKTLSEWDTWGQYAQLTKKQRNYILAFLQEIDERKFLVQDIIAEYDQHSI